MTQDAPSHLKKLAAPISEAQVAAATKLRALMPGWRYADEALDAVADRFQGWDMPSALVKVVTVNELYATRLMATARMAEHVHGLLHANPGPTRDVTLVARIAALPPAPGKKQRHHRSFASKFAHYFIESEAYPIYDEFARQTLRHHLGHGTCPGMDDNYESFVAAFQRLQAAIPGAFTVREIDRYLWLGGAYRAWTHGRRGNIGAESARLFEASAPKTMELLDQLAAD